MTLSKLLLLFQDILISKYLDMVLTTARLLVEELLVLEAFKEIIQQERLILLGEFSGRFFNLEDVLFLSYFNPYSHMIFEVFGTLFTFLILL